MVASLHESRVVYAYIYILHCMCACIQWLHALKKGTHVMKIGSQKKSSKKEVPSTGTAVGLQLSTKHSCYGSIQHFPRDDQKRRVLKRGSSPRVHQVVCCHQAQLELFVERGWGGEVGQHDHAHCRNRNHFVWGWGGRGVY